MGMTGEQAAQEVLPLGRSDPERVLEAADGVSELVRRLNHATFHRAALPYPSSVGNVVGRINAALWGVAAAIVHIIPYAGSAVTIVAVGVAAFVQFEDVARALTVAFCVGLAATVIGMGLTAWIQGRAFRMNAVTVFIALLFFGWLWGGWGLLVGVPLLAIAKTTIDRIPSLQRFMTLLAE